MLRQPPTPIPMPTPAGPGHVRFILGEGTDDSPHWLLIEDERGGWWAMLDPTVLPEGRSLH